MCLLSVKIIVDKNFDKLIWKINQCFINIEKLNEDMIRISKIKYIHKS